MAGKPILGHLLDQLLDTTIDEAVIVVGSQKGSQIVEYATEAYGTRLDLSFPEQTVPRGLGHGVYQARDAVGDEPMLVVLGDMLFVEGYDPFITAHRSAGADVTIGVHEVDDPTRYGVVELGDGWAISHLVEKPADPPSNYAISGLYGIEDSPALFAALESLITDDDRGTGGEFQLTDAFQRLVADGRDVRAHPVSDWYDCGRAEPLLEVNRVLLDRRSVDDSQGDDGTLVIPPVDIGRDVVIESSIVGPYASVDHGTTIINSIVRDSIVGRNVDLDGVNIERSLLGDDATISDDPATLNVGSNGSLEL
ncbi:dTDP-glucose pyrophosphorylase [Halapricum desulfuricans]|uniref:dTDP-glucose pyrophosphorylase n=1 Tax=Halapricum desulfuricans TaxID=2841257 RepID=A0A897NF74_9EURY|nr:dTDP-glucose pyrophosphorylase [Halapricum desulfuricans]